MKFVILSLMAIVVSTSACKFDLPGFKSEPQSTQAATSDQFSHVFKRHVDYEKVNDIGNYRFKRDDSGLVGSGKKIANSVRDLKNAVNSQESESRDDRDWFTTYRFDMDSYKHPLYCGYTSGGSSHRFLSSEDAAVLGLPDSLFTRRLCGACVKIEYKDRNGKEFSEVAIISDKGYRNQMPSNQLDMSPGMSSYFNNNGYAKNIGSSRYADGNIKVTPVECIYNNQRKLSYYVEGHKYWFGINVRRLPIPLKGLSVCVKKNDKYQWRQIDLEAGGVSRKWIYQPSGDYIAGNEIKFRLNLLDDSVFYDSISWNGEKQYYGANPFGKGSKDNCEDIGAEAAHGDLITQLTDISEAEFSKETLQRMN